MAFHSASVCRCRRRLRLHALFVTLAAESVPAHDAPCCRPRAAVVDNSFALARSDFRAGYRFSHFQQSPKLSLEIHYRQKVDTDLT